MTFDDGPRPFVLLGAGGASSGRAWALNDVEKASKLIKGVTGAQPKFVRPPNWAIGEELREELQSHGYHVMALSNHVPPRISDVNSEDYLCASRSPSRCPKPTLVDSVLLKIAERERRGIYTHILVFHELATSTAAVELLIPKLKEHGYRFVRLEQYMAILGASPQD